MAEKSPYQLFAEKMLHADSKIIPEILKFMITDNQADLLMSLPGTADQMATKLNRPTDVVDSELTDLFHKGLAFKKVKNNETLYRAPMHLAQFHDATILWPEAPKAFYELWHDYMEKEWPDLAPVLAKFMPRPFTRVVPIDKSITASTAKVISPENIKEMVENAKSLAVAKCTCRLTMQKCDSPIEVCLQLNNGADYTIERGSGREVSKEEALEIIKQAQDAGLVHVAMNKKGVGHFICNCCGCCCQSFTLLISDGVNLCDPSRYCPEIDQEACNACGLCEDRCHFNALTLEDDMVVINAEKCLGCGQCSFICPEEAITMTEVREPDFIP